MNNDSHRQKKLRIRRFAPLQLGKILAVMYGLGALIFIVPFTIFTFLLNIGNASGSNGVMGAAFGFGFMLAMPFLYAIIGFLCGVIGAFFYNLIAGFIGGIEVDVEDFG